MSLKTVSYNPGTCVRCGGSDGPEVDTGEYVKINLNQVRNADFPDYINGIVTAVDQASPTDTTRTYTVQYESNDLLGAVEELAACDISSLICIGCCDLLQERIDAWEDADEPQVTLSYYIGPDSPYPFFLKAEANTRVPFVTIDFYSWFAGSPATPFDPSIDAQSPITQIPDSDNTDVGFAGGLYGVIVTDTAGHSTTAYVYVDPTRVRYRYATASLPNTASTVAVTLLTGERISSCVITTAGAGILVESISYSGLTATITFTSTNTTGSAIALDLTLQKSLP